MNAVAWSAEKGSRNFLFASQNPTPGAYIRLCREAAVSNFIVSSKGRETQERYWAEAVAIFNEHRLID
jgi:hypothetical protein